MKTYDTLSQAYPHLIQDILDNGERCSPRGMNIKELTGYSFKLNTIEDPLPLQASRKLNYKFGILEGLLNVAGIYPRAIVLNYNKNLERFINPVTDTWDGAYAPRIQCALKSVYEMLKADPDTRQAILPIFKAEDMVGASKSKDVPCTISLQFLLRGGQLNTIATMRSNDILWGTAYDVNQFTTITRALASWLGVRTGWYVHQAGSFHSYDEREEQSFQVYKSNLAQMDKYADFKHPDWGVQDFSITMGMLHNLFSKLQMQIVSGIPFVNDLPEPFKTYADYLTGEKKITYA